jgi:membrane protease YdiL (CAAX protease family)
MRQGLVKIDQILTDPQLVLTASQYRQFRDILRTLPSSSITKRMNSTMKKIATTNWFPWDFFSATFGFSWLCWLPGVLETRGILKLSIPRELLLVLGICGPLVGAIWATVRKSGWTGARRLLARVGDVRIGMVWWLVILVLPLVLPALALLGKGLLAGEAVELEVLGKPWLILPSILFMLLLGGGQEEFGWRGYALDILQARWSALAASVVLGIIWGAWHLPLFFLDYAGQYYIPVWAFMLTSPALSILMTWAYNCTGKRLFAAWLLHGVINAGMDVFPIIQKTVGSDQRAFLILCGLYWLWALVVIGIFGSRLAKGAQKESRSI